MAEGMREKEKANWGGEKKNFIKHPDPNKKAENISSLFSLKKKKKNNQQTPKNAEKKKRNDTTKNENTTKEEI
ncbi:hypothetical protein ID0090_06600 [Helicobacter pylori]